MVIWYKCGLWSVLVVANGEFKVLNFKVDQYGHRLCP